MIFNIKFVHFWLILLEYSPDYDRLLPTIIVLLYQHNYKNEITLTETLKFIGRIDRDIILCALLIYR